MSSSSSLVKFRFTANQLTDSQFQQFIVKLVKRCGRGTVIDILSNSSQRGSCSTDLMNTLIKEVTTEHAQLHSTNVKCESIQNLTAVLIGYIGSFLNQWDYFSLSKCCRSIYLGCNEPNNLRLITIPKKYNISTLHLKRYTRLVCLKLVSSQLNALINAQSLVALQRVHSLWIHNLSRTTAYFDWMEKFATCTWSSVKNLVLQSFGTSTNMFPKDRMLQLLSLFPNVINLRMFNVYFDWSVNLDDDHLWEKVLPKIEVFIDENTTQAIADSIIRSRCSQLTFLSLTDGQHQFPRKLNLQRIVEMECTFPCHKGTIDVIESCKDSLERIRFYIFPGGVDTSNALQISNLMTGEKVEECLFDAQLRNLDAVFTAIEGALFTFNQTKKERIILKLRLEMDKGHNNPVSTMKTIFDFLSRQTEWSIPHFSVSFYFWKPGHVTVPLNKWKEALSNVACKLQTSYDASCLNSSLLVSTCDVTFAGSIHLYMTDDWLMHTNGWYG